MLATMLYLATVVSCLVVPFLGPEWDILRAYRFEYASIPLAIASATQAALHRDVVMRARWRDTFAVCWALGATLVCSPSLAIGNTVGRMLALGGTLMLAATGMLVATTIGVLVNRRVPLVVRACHGGALVSYGAVLVVLGWLVLRPDQFVNTFAPEEAVRAIVLGAAGLTAIGSMVESIKERRRPTSG